MAITRDQMELQAVLRDHLQRRTPDRAVCLYLKGVDDSFSQDVEEQEFRAPSPSTVIWLNESMFDVGWPGHFGHEFNCGSEPTKTPKAYVTLLIEQRSDGQWHVYDLATPIVAPMCRYRVRSPKPREMVAEFLGCEAE